jgi:hypothetical protein
VLRTAETVKTETKRIVRHTTDPALREERRRIARLQELENKITDLEAQMAEIGRKLENPPVDTALVRKWGNQYAGLQKEMDEWLKEWEQIQI